MPQPARLLALLLLLLPPLLRAQTADLTTWHSGAVDLTQGWVTRAGDNPAWAAPAFDDSGWERVQLNYIGASQPEWRWFRLHVKLAGDHPHVHLLIAGGNGTYELYVNGRKADGPQLLPSFEVSRPTERVVSIPDGAADLVLALRTHPPVGYTGWHLPLFLDFELGTPASIETAREAAQSQRLYAVLPSIAINLLLILAGLGALGLFRSQSTRREYLWLGLYLLLLGLSNLLLNSSTGGVLPLAWNDLLGDPLIYFLTIMQIEFTFSFAGQPLGRIGRAYEALLAGMVALNWLTNLAILSTSVYVLVQAAVILPVALVLPVLLLVWYRRGNREAGWLILPSLFPTATTAIFDLGSASIFTGWGKFDFLANPISVGPIALQLSDLGDLLFLLAIAVVMFFRFTRVSREQARSAAELDAAREIQQRLVPLALPAVPGCRIQAAYLPAEEVGGDFYQVIGQPDGASMIVVGDVSGKGLKAAMTGALALGALRTLAAEGLAPAELLRRLNAEILQMQDGGFVTCVCVRISATGEVNLANAGHIPPWRNGQEVTVDSGLPLGVTADAEYTGTTLQLASGDTLTLMSDGVVEAQSATGELFGFDRTAAISMRSAEEIARAASAFGQKDDITVVRLAYAPVEVAHA